MLMRSFTRYAKHRRNWHLPVYFRHVARLATAPVHIIAVQPFRVRHLFRQRSHFFPARSKSLRFERVASAAERRVPNMRRFRGTKSCRRSMHNALPSVIDRKRAILRMLPLRRWRINHESPVETFRSPQLVLRNLMTHRTRHAVLGLSVILLVLIEWKVRKNLPLVAFHLGLKARNRHMADRTFILDRRHRLRMINRFAPHAPLPIRIARRIPHHAGPPREPNGNI